ncbi:MAG: divalent-cation tolerance protein CutA [Vicinamibacterales bacterium]
MENATTPCVVLTTWPIEAAPDAVARALVEARVAACVHVLEAGRSTYRWKGAVETAHERQLIIKTTRGRLGALEAQLKALHPYEVPEWIVLDADAGDAYGAWLADSVTPPA